MSNSSLQNKKVLVTGGDGFLGSYVVENLIRKRGLAAGDVFIPRKEDYNLCTLNDCERVVRIGFNVIIHLAAKVGGIGFLKDRPGEIVYDNVIMGFQLIETARRYGVEKFVIIGTVCAYPEFTEVPFREDDLWNGSPEEVTAPYGLAKKMLLVQAQAYRQQYGFNAVYLLPANLYGPRDHFSPDHSHVIPALIKKVADAKSEGRDYIEVWGSGKATREFLYVEDAAEGIVLATEMYDKPEPVNLGSGNEMSIRETAETICRLMDFKGEIRWDTSRPDGQQRRMLDVSRAFKEFGFRATTPFEEGLRKTIDWYLKNIV